MKTLLEVAGGAVAGILVIGALNAGCPPTKECKTKMAITAVGGCDSHGVCRVELEDGTYKHEYYPIVGLKVCKEE